MSSDNLEELESALKEEYKKTFLLPSWETQFIRRKKVAINEFLDEHYFNATSILKTLVKDAPKLEDKVELCERLIDSTKQSFSRNQEPKNFRAVCESYKTLIMLQENPENYYEYANFLSNELFAEYAVDMFEEAAQICKAALTIFPESAELHALMYDIYATMDRDEEAYDHMIRACKLKYDDPGFTCNYFGIDLWKHNSRSSDDSKIPFNIIRNYRKGAIEENAETLYAYASYMHLFVEDWDLMALEMMIKAHELDGSIFGIEDDIHEIYERALVYIDDESKLRRLKATYKIFCKRNKINLENDSSEPYDDSACIDEDPVEEKPDQKKPCSTKEQKPLEVIVMKPIQIKRKLDEYVIGQEKAKKGAAVGLYQHLLRVEDLVLNGETDLEKTNMTIIGPTGSGKTYIAETLAGIAKDGFPDIPFIVYPATEMTEAGYSGEEARACIAALYIASGKSVEKTEIGIIYIDEMDKKTMVKGSGRDVSGAGVQRMLLPIIEGSKINVEIGEGKHQQIVQIDTSNILFILGGAFSSAEMNRSLSKTVKEKKNKGPKIGFGAEKEKDDGQIKGRLTDQALISFGFIPELVGRVQKKLITNKLTTYDLKKILVEPKEAKIPQYQKIFAKSGIKLEVTDDGLDAIAVEAYKRGSGARSLRDVCEDLFEDPLYNVSEKNTIEQSKNTLIVDKAYVEKVIKSQDS